MYDIELHEPLNTLDHKYQELFIQYLDAFSYSKRDLAGPRKKIFRYRKYRVIVPTIYDNRIESYQMCDCIFLGAVGFDITAFKFKSLKKYGIYHTYTLYYNSYGLDWFLLPMP